MKLRKLMESPDDIVADADDDTGSVDLAAGRQP